MDQENIIIILSDEEDDCTTLPSDESSVLFVDEFAKNGDNPTPEDDNTSEIVDEDLAVTFSKKAAVMPHARYDCSIHLFNPMENNTSNPVDNNKAFCEQCFCYICDKLASECMLWSTSGICHCNAHKRSVFWKDQRDKAVLGYLHVFNFDLLEVDAELRRAESVLLRFEEVLKVEYCTFLKGVKTSLSDIVSCGCYCHAANSFTAGCKKCKSRHVDVMLYDYSRVYNLVSEFLDKADKEKPRTAAVMLLGAAKNFIVHTQPTGIPNTDPKAYVSDAIPVLLTRVTNALRNLMVVGDFSASFSKKLQNFFQSLPLPVKCRWLSGRLNVLQWDDPLLVAVLKGQNITGERVLRGKREVLFEPVVAVQARVEKLKEQKRYRELARYLKVVRSDNKMLIQSMRDHVPFFLCKAGDYHTALQSFFSPTSEMCCSACRLTPNQFAIYLRILTTGKMPVGKDPFLSTEWETVKDASLPKTSEIIKCALRILSCNTAVFMDSEPWVNLISAACCPVMAEDGSLTCASFPVPDIEFQMKARDMATAILKDGSQIQIPKSFQYRFPDQALLLLVTQSLVQRILHSGMINILNIVIAFKANAWALKWFFHSLSARPDILQVFINTLLEELYREKHVHTYRKRDMSEHTLIADFFFFYLLDKRPLLFSVNHQILDDLLNHWNEHDFPWQYYLRCFLQQYELDLMPDKRRFLELIRMKKSINACPPQLQ
ncbi:hypothetical protein ANANG_G00038560 [Anguilla anguilla]|uniref:Uncharacterized protein n=2 Tax=Anguilla anguilla TaxID=7936 RepID=A0A9D3MT94_ANGAN|nr:hypothetical protein ANANG_G00038560 [Anguilla anguilla]